MSEQTASPTPTPKRRRRRTLWILGLLAILLVLLIAAAPWIVAHTGLRDEAINAILASPSVKASSESASFGWFSPLSVHGLRLNSKNNHLDIRVEDIAAERTPWQLWSSAPDLGPIKVEKPHVRLELPLDVEIREPGNRLEPTFSAVVTDASLTLHRSGQDEADVDVDGVNMTVRVVKAEEGRALTVDPLVIFDRRKLSSRLANNLVHLFVPTMSETPQVSGEVSLALDKLHVPLGVSRDQAVKRMELEGKLVLHEVSGKVKNPMGQALIQLVADMNGKDSSNVVHLAHNDEIRFHVRDGRLHHEGLRIGFPDVDPELVLTSRGSVGLDRTVDLFVEIPRLDRALRERIGPAKCHITGTIANPKIAVENASLVLRRPDRKDPIIAADGINLNMHVETVASGLALVVEPVEVFKRSKLNLGVASGLLKLLAPDVDAERQVTGEISLSFNKLHIPLGVDRDEALKQLEAEGKLTLRQVASEVKSPMWHALIKVLADMNGMHPPDVIRLRADAEIPFQMHNGRLHHEGLRIGFPDIDPELVVSSRGSIGMDETLDLFVELPRLDRALRKELGPARCHITGTISRPKITVENGSLVLRRHDRKEPIIAAEGINLSMRVEDAAAGRVLAVEPFEVFRKTKLSLGVASGLLTLLAPDVHGDRQVDGEISLSFSKLRIPLGVPSDQELKHLEAEGNLTLHQVSSEVKSPLWQGLLRLLADMNDKQPVNVIRLAANAEIPFKARDGRLYHEGFRIGFPEIDPELMIRSRGSIGVDETLDLYLELPQLGKDKRDKGPLQCHVGGTIREPKIAVRDASLVIRLKESDKAVLTVDNVNLSFSVEDSKNGSMLTLAPVTIFKKQKLTPAVGDQLLHLIVPTLADLTGVQGEISLSFETFRVPLGVTKSEFEKRVELAGKLQLDQVSVSVKTPLLETLVKVLADMYGKKPSDVVRVVKTADIRFQVRDGRMYHEGLRFGFPDISPDLLITSQGSVGFDKSLDFVLTVPSVLVDKNDLEIKKAPPVHFRITGTIDKPIVTKIKDEKDK
jgi:hypothetical protein